MAGELDFNPATGKEDDRLEGTQGDDSLIFSPRPNRYRSTDSVARMKSAEYARQDRLDEKHESVVNELLPMLGERSRDVNSARIKATIKRIEKRKRGSRSRKGYFGASSGGSGCYGSSR